MKSFLLFISVLLKAAVILACSLSFPFMGSEPTSTPSYNINDCTQAAQPAQEDIDLALNLPGNTFASEEWKRSFSVEENRVSVTWVNDTEGALAYLENLIYNCGYTQADIDSFFSEQALKEVILQNYPQPRLVSSCRDKKDELSLFELSALLHDQTYLVRVWVMKPSDTRLMYLFMTFPETSQDLLDQYSHQIFPGLSACKS